MRSLVCLSYLLAPLLALGADAKSVFAHYLVGNAPAPDFTVEMWQRDISAASASGIDGFALNIAAGRPGNAASLQNAFQAAKSAPDFKFFLSFDYADNGAWSPADIESLLKEYGSDSSYFQYEGKPLASTFEGPRSAGDWTGIKAQTNAFFVPDWSSAGAAGAMNKGTADGLFSWGAWPKGPKSMTTTGDEDYMSKLGGKPYMMAVSPWFYTNLPNYSKNWLWRGDSLWYDRWNQVVEVQPAMVEILTWNDFGESHYIGPLPGDNQTFQLALFESGGAPFDYAAEMPHDAFRAFLPYLIAKYKTGRAEVAKEGVQAWYRINPAGACGTGGTTGNAASQGQKTYAPGELAEDKIFFSALLASPADVSVSIGGAAVAAQFSATPDGGAGAGVYHGSVDMGSGTGQVVVTVTRGGDVVGTVKGRDITKACQAGLVNWNAWSGSS